MSNPEKFILLPGYIFFSEEPYIVTTILGSCIAVCLWDSMRRCGGINHYILPRSGVTGRSAKYGDVSIPHLLKIMVDSGSYKRNLKAHIVGGSHNPELSMAVGEENVKVAKEILNKQGIEILNFDIGGSKGRKLMFHSESGEIIVCKGDYCKRG